MKRKRNEPFRDDYFLRIREKFRCRIGPRSRIFMSVTERELGTSQLLGSLEVVPP